MASRRSSRRLPRAAAIRVAAMLVICVLGVTLGWPLGTGGLWLFPAYLALVLATVEVVRSIDREPGAWLSRRAVRRVLVAAISVVCAGLVAATAGAAGMALSVYLLVVLVVLLVALGRATRRIATAPDKAIDERQEALRNRAHRLSYWALAVAVGGTLVVADLASTTTRVWLGSALGGGLIVLLVLVLGLPAMLVACLEPDGIEPAVRPRLHPRLPLAMALTAFTIAAPFLLSLGVVLLPQRTTSTVSDPRPVPTGAVGCHEFMASASIGVGVEAEIPLHAIACWDGSHAWEGYGMNASDCMIWAGSLTSSTADRCSRTTGPDGTLRFTYRAVVRPELLPFLSRDVTLGVVLDGNGRVVSFP